ncbi:MAG: hypothetical protein GY700_01610 [Propionibacteriaceae bacterium]|nr:hypothetical protein [Propionibacteriaceae bacterium]
MTITEAHKRLDILIDRCGGDGPHLIGVNTVDEEGNIGLSMDGGDDVTILRMGVDGARKAGGITVSRDLGEVTPTLETV